MLDFTSSLYLGFAHASWALSPWSQLTFGRPAALFDPPGARTLASALADLLGCKRASLAASTLHLFWDLCGALDRHRTVIYLDAGTYPVARWGVERAAARGVPVQVFAHHAPSDLCRQLRQNRDSGQRPLVVADGFCPACGKAAPLADYLHAVRPRGGRVVIDDTQALGILGIRPEQHLPYGHGGGGTLRWLGITGNDILVINSLAKGFGAPLAVLAGNTEVIHRFEEWSEIRTYSSPPSVAAIHAAKHALLVNQQYGDTLRRHLCHLVRLFRISLLTAGLNLEGGDFPVQTLAPVAGLDAARLHQALLAAGIRAVLRRDHDGTGARVSFLITVNHKPEHIKFAASTIARLALARIAPIRGVGGGVPCLST